MEIVNRVSAFWNYQNFSNVIAEKPKPASENCEPIKQLLFRLWRHDDRAE